MTTAVATLGTILRRNGTPIAQIQDIEGPDLSTDTQETTTHDSPDATEEKIATLKRVGEVTFPLVFRFNEPTHGHQNGLIDAWQTRALDSYELEYPDGSGWQFSAYCTGFQNSAPVDGFLSADVTLAISGAPTPQTSFSS